jgi:hypothetical protein
MQALGWFILSSLIAFFPCLILHQAYYANDLLVAFGPFRSFLHSELMHGHFPLWNPYNFSGQPFLADLQNLMLYPLNYLTIFFSVPYGLSLFFFIHMVLAATGMYFWLRTLKTPEFICRLGGFIFSLSCFFWHELIHPPVLASFAWVPWVFACIELTAQTYQYFWGFMTGLVFALFFLCGSFQIILAVVYAGLIYFLFRTLAILRNQKKSKTHLLKIQPSLGRLCILTLFFLWGVLPVFFQLIPTQQFSHLCTRETAHHSYQQFNSILSMKPKTLYTFLFPTMNIPRSMSVQNAILQLTPTLQSHFLAYCGSFGVWALFLILLAFQKKDTKPVILLSIIASITILIALGKYFFLQHLFCLFVPGFSLLRAPFRFIFLYVLCAVVLAMFGYQTLEQFSENPQLQPKSSLKFYAYLYASIFFLIGLIRLFRTWREETAIVLGILGLTLWWSPSWKKLGKWLFIFSLIFPLFLQGWDSYQLGPASNFNYQSNLAYLNAAKPLIKHHRVILLNDLIYPIQSRNTQIDYPLISNLLTPLKIKCITGYNPLHLKKYQQLMTTPFRLQLLGVEGILSTKHYTNSPNYTLKKFPGFYFYQLNPLPPMVNAFTHVSVLKTSHEVLQQLSNPQFKLSNGYFSHPIPPALQSQLSKKNPHLKYKWILDHPDHQVYKIQLNHASMVRFSKIVYPGWQARIDHHPVPIFTSDYLFQTLFIPAGKHRVEFSFHPPWLNLFLLLAIIWMVTVITYLISHWILIKRSTVDIKKVAVK